MRCINYCGVTCVDGNCPNVLADAYAEYGHKHITCGECWFYEGCSDCVFFGTSRCLPINENGELVSDINF